MSRRQKGGGAPGSLPELSAVATRGDFATTIAASLRAAHVEIAAQWLERLRELLPIPATTVFPTASLLDHIPDLITHIADDLASPAEQPLVANAEVVAKAQELGELRYRQQASVHQLQREYRLLADVLTGFVGEEVARRGITASAADALGVAARLQEAVFVLMQSTVDTFVALYADTVARQTTRLEGFNRMVTHELRQPLGTIRSAVDLLRRSDVTNDVRERSLEIIESNSRRMAQLTTRLLTLSSLEVESLQTQETDLALLVGDVAAQLEEMAKGRGVTVVVEVPSAQVVTDVARAELILVNLVSNAIKYSDPGKPERVVRIAAVEKGETIELTVSDNGVGIAAADRERVFEGFYRAHAARDGELGSDGLGLGLAIVAECARHVGASVGLRSEEGQGTTVSVLLPKHCAISPFAPAAPPER